jgi:hypothetical protein
MGNEKGQKGQKRGNYRNDPGANQSVITEK